ncbi:TetR/AcrR family transcriptional regulator [Nocardia sp. NBC_01329]|uniref:TetR/AcrR family transcriptional regulator n=1 Tax=Nocardia sp. NBC_01329 TaxID=2903594 RepID=UPI002E163727|nr:TetR/AcrR family transcriptional regulator [Nocardia sp. NBC_01329]
MTGTAERHSSVPSRRTRATTDAIVDAARRAMHEHGLDVTVDEIAALAGVGRRTVFRHFATRENLIQVAMAAGFADFSDSLPHYDGTDWQQWLTELVRQVHHRTAEAGRTIRHLRTRRLPPGLAAAHDENLAALHQLFTAVTGTVWAAAGGSGTPPEQLRRTVAAHLSPLFTQAVLLDAEGTPEFAAEIATAAITATLYRLLDNS